MSLNSTRKVKIFAHDAASANVVLAYTLLHYNDGSTTIMAYPKGPAVKIFDKEISEIATIYNDTNYNFATDDIVITGLSGINSNYELEIIKIANFHNVRDIISLLDRAINIDERFTVNESDLKNYLPHKILIPAKEFKNSRHTQINRLLQYYENPYWNYIYKKYYTTPPIITNDVINNYKNNYIVFFTEYIYQQYGDTLGYDEFSLMRDFISIFNNSPIPIFIKLHPSEDKNKYDEYIAGQNIYIVKDKVSTQELLYYSKIVFGNMSSVFYEALLLKKETYSLQLNFKRDIFELTLDNKINRVETIEDLEKIFNEIIN